MRDTVEVLSEGPWLGKARRTFHLSNTGYDLLHKMSLNHGVTASSMLELIIRTAYVQSVGPLPVLPLVTRKYRE